MGHKEEETGTSLPFWDEGVYQHPIDATRNKKQTGRRMWHLLTSTLQSPSSALIGRLEYRATWQRTMGLAVLQPQHHCAESKGLSFGAEKQCLKDWYIG